MRAIGSKITKLSAFLLYALLFLVILVFFRECRGELAQDFHPPSPPVILSAADEALGFTSVNVGQPGSDAIMCFYHPAAYGQVVVLVHGTASDRNSLLAEAKLLVRHGFGTLLLDFPGQGGSGGSLQWNEPERLALSRSIDWLYEQPKDKPASVGLYGFSMGSMIALREAVKDHRILAMVLAGTFTTYDELYKRQAGQFGLLTAWAGRCAGFFGGANIWHDQPLQLISQLALRPILLISGSSDIVTPPDMADTLYRAALEPKFHWLSLGAGHGGYYAAQPLQFEREVVSFYEAFLPKRAAMPSFH